MAKRKKVREKPRKPPASWQYFPLYGLLIDEDDGVHAPLWGDATLVSRKSVEAQVARRTGQEQPLLTHGKVSEALGVDKIAEYGNPESLVEVVPHSYIAVRKKNDFSATHYRAERIRAVLSATLFLRGLRLTAFCADPREFAWYIAARDIDLESGHPKASIRPIINPYIVQRPFTVTKEDLRTSVKHGKPVPHPGTTSWDLHSEHPVSILLTESRPQSGFRARLVAAALQIQNASCMPSHFSQLQAAVAALQVLLNTSDFNKLGQRLTGFFRGEEQRERIERILELRHKATHEGRMDEEPTLEQPTKDALVYAWSMFDIATAYSEQLNGEQFEMYTQGLADADRIDDTVGRILGQPTQSEQSEAFHSAFKNLAPRMTLIAANVAKDKD